jgi:hypothetical protein
VTVEEPTPQDVVEQLAARRTDALNTLELLRTQRARVVEESAKFENPQAVLDYLDFFIPAIEEVVAESDRISGEIVERVRRSHIDILRQIAANCRVEQRRCLMFRDKCINRPLPNEQISTTPPPGSNESSTPWSPNRSRNGSSDVVSCSRVFSSCPKTNGLLDRKPAGRDRPVQSPRSHEATKNSLRCATFVSLCLRGNGVRGDSYVSSARRRKRLRIQPSMNLNGVTPVV